MKAARPTSVGAPASSCRCPAHPRQTRYAHVRRPPPPAPRARKAACRARSAKSVPPRAVTRPQSRRPGKAGDGSSAGPGTLRERPKIGWEQDQIWVGPRKRLPEILHSLILRAVGRTRQNTGVGSALSPAPEFFAGFQRLKPPAAPPTICAPRHPWPTCRSLLPVVSAGLTPQTRQGN